MAYIFETSDYQRDLRTYANEQARLNRIMQTLRVLYNPEGQILRFRNSNIFKKRIGSNFRIILQKVIVNIEDKDYTIYCALQVTPHDDRYTEIYDPDVRRWQEKNGIQNNRCEMERLENWMKDEIQREREAERMPPPPDLLIDWLNSENFEVQNTVFEMFEWTDSIQKEDVKNYRTDIPKIIFDIHESGEIQEVVINTPRPTIKLTEGKNNIFILYEKYGDSLFLYKVFKGRPQANVLNEVIDGYKYEGQEITIELLKRDAKRAYPTYILADIDLWFNIQEDSVGNLALSPEQIDLIKNPTYPLFINGQAGSGKSTMLFYLFAHLLYTHKDNDLKPLFLTYNKKLLETARISIRSILKNHPNFSENPIPESEIIPLFYPFQTFILNKVLTVEQKAQFSKDKYISFNKFRRYYLGNRGEFYCQLNNKHRFTPELVWHIIRSYIKGSSINLFSIDDYRNLPRKDKTVRDEVFQEVMNTIYTSWYKGLKDAGFWDDQDLIQFTLQETTEFPKYPLIFCDESQDFTKNEIELILRLSSFTDHDLTDYQNFPLAFAGDPYQTINPTGFRWESLKSIFSDKFKKLIERGNFEISFTPLSQNYRSKPAIIKFSNTIQLFRHIYLNISELEPQIPYQRLHSIDPCLFVLGDNIQEENVKEVTDSTIIIVPSDSDVYSEKEFVKTDDTLKSCIEDIPEDEEKPIANVLSAASSKGLEYDKVIVYKFGSHVPESFQKIINGEKLNDSETIELSHYFNKLYVAVSRARDYLFIIEDENGKNNFWNHFSNFDLFQPEFEKNRKWRKDDINLLIEGRDKDLTFLKENDPLKVAKEFEENGMAMEDPTMLLRASQFYGIGMNSKKASFCEAWAAFFNEKWREAGEKFQRLNLIEEAQKSYWRGQHWYQLITLINNDKQFEVRISKFMTGGLELNEFFNDKDFIDKLEIGEISWKMIIDKIRTEIKIDKSDNFLKAAFASKIAIQGIKDFFDIAADLYYADNLYEKAIEMWERNKGRNHTDYFQAKLAITTEINDKLDWLDKLHKYEEILKFKGKTELIQTSHYIIFNAMISSRLYAEALDYDPLELLDKATRLINSLANITEHEERFANKERLLFHLLKRDERDFIKTHINSFLELFGNEKVIYDMLSYEGGVDILNHLRLHRQNQFKEKVARNVFNAIKKEISQDSIYEHIGFAFDIGNEDHNTAVKYNIEIFNAIKNAQFKPQKSVGPNNKKRINGIIRLLIDNKQMLEESKLTFKNLVNIAFKMDLLFEDQIEIIKITIDKEQTDDDWATKLLEITERINFLKSEHKRTLEDKLNKKNLTSYNYDVELQQISEEIDVLRTNIAYLTSEKRISEKKEVIRKPQLLPQQDAIEVADLKIIGVNDISPDRDVKRNRVSFILNTCEMRVNTKNSMIFIENLDSGITDNINLKNREFNERRITTNRKYKLRFSEKIPRVDFEIDGRKIRIELNT